MRIGHATKAGGYDGVQLFCLVELGRDKILTSEWDSAKSFLLQATRLAWQIGTNPLLFHALLEVANLELRLGNSARARQFIRTINPGELGTLRETYNSLAAQ